MHACRAPESAWHTGNVWSMLTIIVTLVSMTELGLGPSQATEAQEF